MIFSILHKVLAEIRVFWTKFDKNEAKNGKTTDFFKKNCKKFIIIGESFRTVSNTSTHQFLAPERICARLKHFFTFFGAHALTLCSQLQISTKFEE